MTIRKKRKKWKKFLRFFRVLMRNMNLAINIVKKHLHRLVGWEFFGNIIALFIVMQKFSQMLIGNT